MESSKQPPRIGDASMHEEFLVRPSSDPDSSQLTHTSRSSGRSRLR